MQQHKGVYMMTIFISW